MSLGEYNGPYIWKKWIVFEYKTFMKGNEMCKK
jgi:hypothetical protein